MAYSMLQNPTLYIDQENHFGIPKFCIAEKVYNVSVVAVATLAKINGNWMLPAWFIDPEQ